MRQIFHAQIKRSFNLSNAPSRVWFLAKGCRQVPPEECGNKILWYHPDGYFLSQYGNKLLTNFTPSMRTPGRHCHNGERGQIHPTMRDFGQKACHRLACYAFYGPCPVYYNADGKPYKGIVHHLIEEPMNFRIDNLLCWLTRKEHAVADARQRALRKVVPDGNLHIFTYERLARLQDPRVTSDVTFDRELDKIRSLKLQHVDPQTQINYELNHHCEL